MESLLAFIFALGLPLWLVAEEVALLMHRQPRTSRRHVGYKAAHQHGRA